MLEYIQNPQAKVDSKAGDVLQVIGAGLPRTGTSSLVVALGILGFGPSHHFTEVIYKPESAPVFDRLIQACRIPTSRFAPKSKAESAAILDELREIFRGYKSSLDGPACHFVPELMELYPNAKVVLSVRDNDEVWYKSLMDTVGIQSYDWYWYLKMPTGTLGFTRLARTFFEAWKQGTGGQLRPELHSMHTQWVRKVVPKEKLLEFNVKQGWGPLCKFLEVPIPDQPFPRTNDSASLRKSFYLTGGQGAALWLAYIGMGTGSLYFLSHPDKVTSLISYIGSSVTGLLGGTS